jgi:hypothetical protein
MIKFVKTKKKYLLENVKVLFTKYDNYINKLNRKNFKKIISWSIYEKNQRRKGN